MLAGDIGGTKTLLAVFSTEAGPRALISAHHNFKLSRIRRQT